MPTWVIVEPAVVVPVTAAPVAPSTSRPVTRLALASVMPSPAALVMIGLVATPGSGAENGGSVTPLAVVRSTPWPISSWLFFSVMPVS